MQFYGNEAEIELITKVEKGEKYDIILTSKGGGLTG